MLKKGILFSLDIEISHKGNIMVGSFLLCDYTPYRLYNYYPQTKEGREVLYNFNKGEIFILEIDEQQGIVEKVYKNIEVLE